MKPFFLKVLRSSVESFTCKVRSGSAHMLPSHFHPEYELTLILKGHGYRIVGDHIANYQPGDLLLLGPNLPHFWQNDQLGERIGNKVPAIVIQFLDSFLGDDFFKQPELAHIARLFARSARGLHFTGQTRDRIADKMQIIAQSSGFTRMLELLSIFDILAHAKDYETLSSPGFSPVLNEFDQERMSRVCQYINAHFLEPIYREDVAAQCHLSPAAFSRYFKARTGKTLADFVNELRVGRACRLLIESDLNVTEICQACGFDNASNFNRRFRESKGLSPRAFRQRLVNPTAGKQARVS